MKNYGQKLILILTILLSISIALPNLLGHTHSDSTQYHFSLTSQILNEVEDFSVRVTADHTLRVFDRFQMAIKYDTNFCAFESLSTNLNINYQEIEPGFIAIHYAGEEHLSGFGFSLITLRFQLKTNEQICREFEIVDISEDMPILVGLKDQEFTKPNICTLKGETCFKVDVDDPVTQATIMDIHGENLSILSAELDWTRFNIDFDIDNEKIIALNSNNTYTTFSKVLAKIADENVNVEIPSTIRGQIFYYEKEKIWILVQYGNEKLNIVASETKDFSKIIKSKSYDFKFDDQYNVRTTLMEDWLVLSTSQINSTDGEEVIFNLSEFLDGKESYEEFTIDKDSFVSKISTAVNYESSNSNLGYEPIFLNLKDDNFYNHWQDALIIQEFDSKTSTMSESEIALAEIDLNYSYLLDLDFQVYLEHTFFSHSPKLYDFGEFKSMLLCFASDVKAEGDKLGIRWIELRKYPESPWEIYQESTFAPEDEYDRIFPEICMDKEQNIILVYNRLNEEEELDLCFTARKGTDNLNEMTFGEEVLGYGTLVYGTNNRFGASLKHRIANESVDPGIFFVAGSYSKGNKLSRIDLGSKTPIDLCTSNIITTNDQVALAEGSIITFEIRNLGLETAENSTLHIDLEGQFTDTIYVDEPIVSNGLIRIDYTLKRNFLSLSDLCLSVEVVQDKDARESNNKLSRILRFAPRVDAKIVMHIVDGDCKLDNRTTTRFGIVNTGFDSLKHATISFYINGALEEQFDSDLNLGHAEMENFDFISEVFYGEENEISITIDEVSTSSGITSLGSTYNFLYYRSSEAFKRIDLTTTMGEDGYWNIRELETGIIVAEGGPNILEDKTMNQILCISPYECYLFTVKNASYSLIMNRGIDIIEGTAINETKTIGFCIGGGRCQIKPDILVQNTTNQEAKDGRIEVSIQNRIESFEYNIDKGIFLDSGIFENLQAGSHIIQVRSTDLECFYQDTVYVFFDSIVNIDEVDDKQVELYPNPATDILYIKSTTNEPPENIEIFNAKGQNITDMIQENPNKIENQIDVSNLRSGFYFVKASINDKVYVNSFVVGVK